MTQQRVNNIRHDEKMARLNALLDACSDIPKSSLELATATGFGTKLLAAYIERLERHCFVKVNRKKKPMTVTRVDFNKYTGGMSMHTSTAPKEPQLAKWLGYPCPSK